MGGCIHAYPSQNPPSIEQPVNSVPIRPSCNEGTIMVGTYLTEPLRVAADVINHPWFILGFAAFLGLFMILLVFMIIPSMWRNQSTRR